MKMDKKFWIGLVIVTGLLLLFKNIEVSNTVAGIVVGVCTIMLVAIWCIKKKRQNEGEKKIKDIKK